MSQTYEIVNGVYIGPKHWKGDLNFNQTSIRSLGVLESVGGHLGLYNTPIKSLGSLRSVGENFTIVGGYLDLLKTQVRDLGCLESIGDYLSLPDGTVIYDFSIYKQYAWNVLSNLPKEDYPLYMTHENWIIRAKVNRFLETGEV